MKIHHVGYLVKKINRAVEAFLKLGYKQKTNVVVDEDRKIDICFMTKDGYCIELVSPRCKDSVVYSLQKKYGNSPYHICYISKHMEMDVEKLCNQGYVKYDEPREAIAFSGNKVCFLIHPYLGMVELLEEK